MCCVQRLIFSFQSGTEKYFYVTCRLPPTIQSTKACQAVKQLLEKDPPYVFLSFIYLLIYSQGAQVTFQVGDPADGT